MPTVPRGFSGTAGAKFGVFVRGYKSLQRKLATYEKVTQLKSYEALKRSLILLEAEMKKLITYGYYRPAVQRGRMRLSVGGQIISFTPVKAEAKVGTNVYYAIYVHEGTRFMIARPFAVDALDNKRNEIMNMFEKAYKYDLGI